MTNAVKLAGLVTADSPTGLAQIIVPTYAVEYLLVAGGGGAAA